MIFCEIYFHNSTILENFAESVFEIGSYQKKFEEFNFAILGQNRKNIFREKFFRQDFFCQNFFPKGISCRYHYSDSEVKFKIYSAASILQN